MPDPIRISARCEVLVGHGKCGNLATYGYPAHGGGFMALCTSHAKPHEKYVMLVGDIRRGIRHKWWDEVIPDSRYARRFP
jgi:hypothetical protein